MSDVAPPPAWISDDEIIGRPKRIMTHPESAVQRGVVRFCKRAIACEFELAAHDRSQQHGDNSHIYEAQRGYRRAWPDVEIVLDGGAGFRCELKAPGVTPKAGGDQLKMIQRLNDLGHPAAWANSVTMFGQEASQYGVPLVPGWWVVAAHEDELVAADIRRQEMEAAAKHGAAPSVIGKQRSRAATASRTRRWAKIQQGMR